MVISTLVQNIPCPWLARARPALCWNQDVGRDGAKGLVGNGRSIIQRSSGQLLCHSGLGALDKVVCMSGTVLATELDLERMMDDILMADRF